MNTKTMIKLQCVLRRYPLAKQKFFCVLRNITIDIEEGEFVSAMAPPGAGKPALLHILGMDDQRWSVDRTVHLFDGRVVEDRIAA
jgi:ABC-type lipoprotein export system ATPase subunit